MATQLKPDWRSDCGRVELYCGDSGEILSACGSAKLGALVTDPPYGIGEARGKNKSRSWKGIPAKDYGVATWDDRTSPEIVAQAIALADEAIIFGGNYYDLPPSPCWLVWDKCNGESDFADAELAWTNLRGAVRLKQHLWNGMLRKNREPRVHPTQKPVDVMTWVIGFTKSELVFDPFMGSGTTGVAAIRQGRRFVGIERERTYVDYAIERIREELQRDAFLEPDRQSGDSGSLFTRVDT